VKTGTGLNNNTEVGLDVPNLSHHLEELKVRRTYNTPVN